MEAEKFLVDMEANGIPRDAGTFRVLITNFCKIRKTEDAMNLFRRMGEWGCSEDADTYRCTWCSSAACTKLPRLQRAMT